MNYASRSSRIVGQIVDGLVAFAPLPLLYLIRSDSPALSGVLTIGAIGWTLFHILLADGWAGGQRWGKRVAGTRVVDAVTEAPCTFGQSLIRNLLLAFLGPINWLFIFGERHQRLGDKSAGTIVVRAT